MTVISVIVGSTRAGRFSEKPAKWMGHTVLWTAVASGTVSVPNELRHGDFAAFEPSSEAVEFEARTVPRSTI